MSQEAIFLQRRRRGTTKGSITHIRNHLKDLSKPKGCFPPNVLVMNSGGLVHVGYRKICQNGLSYLSLLLSFLRNWGILLSWAMYTSLNQLFHWITTVISTTWRESQHGSSELLTTVNTPRVTPSKLTSHP